MSRKDQNSISEVTRQRDEWIQLTRESQSEATPWTGSETREPESEGKAQIGGLVESVSEKL